MRNIVIGVDGGGTKTNFAAFDIDSGSIVASSTAKSINSYSLSMPAALSNFCEGLKLLKLNNDDHIKAVSIGDPAMDDSVGNKKAAEFRGRICEACGFKEDTEVLSCSDAFMALYALSGGEPAALVIAGTGSMGLAFKKKYIHGKNNEIITVGGWGEPTTDGGSAYYIAVKAICKAMDAFDGIAPYTALCREVIGYFKAGSPRDLINVFNNTRIEKSKLASFATIVNSSALNGDSVAYNILASAGDILGRYAVSLLKQIEKNDCRVGIYGSVLMKSKAVRESFDRTVYTWFPEADICVPEKPPEYGAIQYALDKLNKGKEEI